MAYDPINVPKLAVISVGGFMALGALFAKRDQLFKKQYRLVVIFGAAFIAQLTAVLLISGTNFYQEFFGTFGRATGYVAYVALTALLVVAVISSSAAVLKQLVRFLLTAGLASIVYGLFQSLDMDPVKWVNQYSPVIGFLGNPNFQSSFVGLCGVMIFALLISSNVKLWHRAGYLMYLVIATYVINETESQQGFLVLLGGVTIVSIIWIARSKIKFLIIPSLFLGFVGFVLVALGSLNSGPLASLLYKASVTYRGDYWRAGWKMTIENPVFGVGLDSYGDWYRRARTVEATLRRGPDIVSNAAHNVLLDLSSNGGFPLLITYLLMMGLVVTAAIKVLKRSAGFEPMFIGLLAVWIAYQTQSIISLNQLGLAIWSWVISGLIIGYEINTRSEESPNRVQEKKGRSASPIAIRKLPPITSVGILCGLMLGLLVGLPALLASSNFKSNLEAQTLIQLESAARIEPGYCQHTLLVASILAENKLSSKALDVLLERRDDYADCFELWSAISKLSIADERLSKEAEFNMKRLDPNNPGLK